ncbi:TPA: permease [Candidatus Nomurabacteria bacterium]|nr:permease [Candidatus Nomurabacteria bacterium]
MIIFACLAFLATLTGGLIALKLHKQMHLLLGFTAGVILSVVSFDIFPELVSLSTELNIEVKTAMIAFVVGFLLFHIIEKYILIHHTHENEYGEHHHPTIGVGSAIALIGHSFLDGMGIGLAFQISNTTGIAIALAVLAHDFSDGINTVSLMLSHKNSHKKAFLFLLLDAIAPVLGAVSTLFFVLAPQYSLIYLGVFAGFLLYIGASDILPEAHSKHSKWTTVAMTIFGALLMYYILSLI